MKSFVLIYVEGEGLKLLLPDVSILKLEEMVLHFPVAIWQETQIRL